MKRKRQHEPRNRKEALLQFPKRKPRYLTEAEWAKAKKNKWKLYR